MVCVCVGGSGGGETTQPHQQTNKWWAAGMCAGAGCRCRVPPRVLCREVVCICMWECMVGAVSVGERVCTGVRLICL